MTIKTERGFINADRYLFDFKMCSYELGWAQVDTRQDASYYGTWTNPETFQILNYAEGDVTRTNCETVDEYKQAMRECAEWNKTHGWWLGIDPGLRPEMKDRFEKLGLQDLLH
jgi:hypothetical protein